MIEEHFPRCRHIEGVQHNLSAEIQSHVDTFLKKGGEIRVIPSHVRAAFDVESTPVVTERTVINAISCKTCGKEFRAVKRQGAQRKYCSRNCRVAAGRSQR